MPLQRSLLLFWDIEAVYAIEIGADVAVLEQHRFPVLVGKRATPWSGSLKQQDTRAQSAPVGRADNRVLGALGINLDEVNGPAA